MALKYLELVEKLRNFPKYAGTELRRAAPVVNDGFPGTFNLSFTEPEWLEEFGSFLDLNKQFVYSKIQPVIRLNDFLEKIACEEGAPSKQHLCLFEMADVSGIPCLPQILEDKELETRAWESLWRFLVKEIGLEPEQLLAKYFEGGTVFEATKGKYYFPKILPKDDFTLQKLLELGMPAENLLPDRTRDSLLALNIFGRPTPWGYRSEVFYRPENGPLIDIATVEALLWRPVFRNNEIISLTDWKSSCAFSVIGAERLLMAANNLDSVYDCNHIKPLIEQILEKSKESEVQEARIVCEALRSTHRIIVDAKNYRSLSKNRRYRFRKFVKAAAFAAKRLGFELSEKNIDDALELQAKLQPQYPELKNYSETTKTLTYLLARLKITG